MAAFDKVSVGLVMDMAKCDERTAKDNLKANKGNVSRAVTAARNDAESAELGKRGGPMTGGEVLAAIMDRAGCK